MPIDPRVVFNLQQDRIADPFEQASKGLQLRNLLAQQQAHAVQAESAGIELQEKKRQLGASQQLRELFAAEPNVEKILPKVYAIDPKVGQSMEAGIQERKKREQEIQKTQLETSIKRAERFGSLAQSVTDENSMRQALGTAVGEGLIKSADADSYLSQPWSDSVLQSIRAKGMQALSAKEQIQARLDTDNAERQKAEDVRKQAEEARKAELHPTAISKAAADVKAAEAKATQEGLVTTAMQNPTDQEAQQAALSPEKRAELDMRAKELARANTPAELAVVASDPNTPPEKRTTAKAALKILEDHAKASRTVVQTTLPGLSGKSDQVTGNDYLQSLPPSIAAQVKAVAEGKDAMPSAASRSQGAAQLRDMVYRYDPSFSTQRAQVRKAFTTGPDGKNIGALNTAIVHLGRLGDTAEALNNGSFTPGNQLFNYFKDKFGSETVTNFGLLKDAVAGEMAAALKGTATDVEIEKMGKSIRATNSPAQMRGVISEGMSILNDKATTYSERYHRESPEDSTWDPILPSAKSQLDKHGVKRGSSSGSSNKPPLSSFERK